MERINGPTPAGGAYAELYMFDKNGTIVESKDNAVTIVIRECDRDGNLILETWGGING